jgi:hypothetical protein
VGTGEEDGWRPSGQIAAENIDQLLFGGLLCRGVSERIQGELRRARAEGFIAVKKIGTDGVGEHGGGDVVIVARNPDRGVLSLDGDPSRIFVLDHGLGVPAVVFNVIEGEPAHGPLHLEQVLKREGNAVGVPDNQHIVRNARGGIDLRGK